MEMEIKVKGCPYEDQESLKIFAHAMDISSALWEARNMIRERLKWGEGISEQEVDFLEKLQEELYVDGIE